jgi:hypothetical protein
MSERKEAVYILVSQDEDVDAIIARLQAVLPAAIQLHIPASATAFQDFEDFRKLKALLAQPGTSITVAAEDKAIERLAHLLGFPVGTYSPGPPATLTPEPEAESRPYDIPMKPSSGDAARHSLIPIALGLATAVAVLATVAFFVAPAISSAQVVLTAKTETLSQQIPLALVPEGSTVPETLTIRDQTFKLVAAPAKVIEVSAETSGEGIAHGSKTVPDRPASGRVRLSNPNPFPVAVKAGTTVATVRGVAYVTTGDVTVPAADPFGSGVLGTAEVGVKASAGGSATNLDARAIQTRLDNGVYVINPEPISGGTDRQVPVVSAEDLQTLREDLETKLRSQLRTSLAEAVPEGYRLVTETIKMSDVQAQSDQEEGAVAERFNIRLTAKASGLAYRPEELRALALRSAQALVSGKRLGDASAVAIDASATPFELISTEPTVVFTTKVTVKYRYVPDDATIGSLKRALAGKPEGEARAFLASLPYIASASITRSPPWLPGGLPGSPERITVRFEENQ